MTMMKKWKSGGVGRAGLVAVAGLAVGGLWGQEATDEVFELEQFVVTGSEFDAYKAAIQNQREAGNIKTVVDAGAFGDVTEGNVGEFLKYLPGVSVDFVSADVRSVSVRGLASSLTPVTMDGNRVASASSSESSRTFEFEQVSLNNVARIEVVKVPTPAMEADSLGGAVNMVSRNAFEMKERKFDYRAYLTAPSGYLDWGKTAGPGNEATRKVRPGFDLTYSDPLTDNFGIVVNYTNGETFTPQRYFLTQWDTAGQGQASPYLRYFSLRDGPKISKRQSGSLKADWKVFKNTVLSLGVQRNLYSTTFFNREIRWETSNTGPGYYSPEYTRTDPAKDPNGRFRHQLNTREKVGNTTHLDAEIKHFLERWEISYGGYWSKSENEYRDTGNGFFERMTFRTPSGALDVSYEDIGENGPGEVITKLGAADFDPFTLGSLNALDTSSAGLRSGPEYASDTIYGGKLDVKRALSINGLPATLQAGVLYRQQERDIARERYAYGLASGVSAPAADQFLDTHYTGQDLGWGWPAPEWPDPYQMYQYFLDNPDKFALDEVASVIYNEKNRLRMQESVSAGYVMGSLSLADNRLRILGGVRYERTDTEGEGSKVDPYVIYARNPDGSFILKLPALGITPTNLVLLPEFQGSDKNPAVLAKRVRAQYAGRITTTNHYSDYYPSIHLTYLMTPQLQARFAYARTLGRPNINEIAPSIREPETSDEQVGDPEVYLIVNNPELDAYRGDNFDLTVEYYFESGGMFSVGLFHKKISGFIDTENLPLTVELAEKYGIDPSYVDLEYWIKRSANVGDVTINGIELALIQDLTFLPGWAEGFSVFANTTILSTEGNYYNEQQLVSSYVPGFVKKSANWGVTYDRGRWDVRLKWNLRGRQMRDSTDPTSIRGNFADGSLYNRFYDERLTTDLNIEFRINKQIRLFLNGRNIFNEPTDELRYGADTPEYAYLMKREQFGALWTLGVKGTF